MNKKKDDDPRKQNSFKMITEAVKAIYRFDKTSLYTMLILSVINAASPYIMIFTSSYILDGLVSGITIPKLLLAAGTGLLAVFIVHVVRGYIDKIYSLHTDLCFRNFNMELSRRTLTMDYQLLDSPLANEIKEKISRDNDWGAGFYSMFDHLPWFLDNIFGLIAATGVTIPLIINGSFFNSPFTILCILLLFIFELGMSLFDTKYLTKKEFKLMDDRSGITGYFWHFVYGSFDYKSGKDIRIYNSSELIKNKISNNDDWSRKRINKLSQISGIKGLVGGFSYGILQGGIYLLVIIRAAAGMLTVGDIVRYAAILSNFINSILGIIKSWGHLAVTARRQQGKLEYMSILDVMHKGTLPIEKRRDNEYEIEFKNVSFKYPGSENWALRNLSMKFKIGQRLAIVGMNGSGKTTMIKLLSRLYDPDEGEITLNGFNIKKYDYNEYTKIFSTVFQDFKLFSFSLGQNIAASVDYNPEKAEKCLKTAGLDNLTKNASKGLETPLYSDYEEGGIEISGGEAQKIALARALYKDAPFIVLDEPTAALDPIAEYEVYSKFNEIAGGKTAIYISHRLSSCRFCGDIAVFHEGRLIQWGSHDTLLADADGKYYELWNAQAQYYAEGQV